MATQTRIQPFYLKSNIPGAQPIHVGDPNSTQWIEDTSQTYGVGDLIYADNADEGKVKICGTSTNRLNTEILGVASKAATGTAGTYVRALGILPSDVYVMNVFHSTPASAITALTDIGKVYGIILNSSKWAVDIENSVEGSGDALARVRVHGFPERNPVTGEASAVGDTYGLVLVTFLPESRANDADPSIRVLQLY